MSLVYQSLLGSFLGSFILASLLLPGAALIVFGWQLWRKGERGAWSYLHFFYILLFSLFLEYLGVIVAYWFIFELEFERLPKILVNPVFLWLYMFFIAFLHDRFFGKNLTIVELREEPLWFDLVSDRKQIRVDLRKLDYIESRNERCFLYLEGEEVQTRERITQLEQRLPEGFLRIHRSFIINPERALGISKQEVQMNSEVLPVSRTYKQQVEVYLANSPKKSRSN